MRYNEKYLHCEDTILETHATEMHEIADIIQEVQWQPDFSFTQKGKTYRHQAAYNKALALGFKKRDWQLQPLLAKSPRLIGDASKNLVFVEVQFGNSATIYRDFYKFQYGLKNRLLSLAVLIVPDKEQKFFLERPNSSVRNMANFELALRYFSVLPIAVPTWVIGLQAGHGY